MQHGMDRKKLVALNCLVFVLLIAAAALLVACNHAETPDEPSYAERIATLDLEFKNQYESVSSNVEICRVTAALTTQWIELGNEIYNSLAAMSDPQSKQSLAEAKDCWDTYYNDMYTGYQDHIEALYSPGTIVPLLDVDYEYKINRLRTIELYYMYATHERSASNVAIDFEYFDAVSAIDASYKTEYDGAASLPDAEAVYGEFAEKWLQLIDNCYQSLSSEDDAFVKELEESKARWDYNFALSYEGYRFHVEKEHGIGAAARALTSKHACILNRFRAIELCYIMSMKDQDDGYTIPIPYRNWPD